MKNKPRLARKRRHRAFLDSFQDETGKTVFVVYEKGNLVFRHRYAHEHLAVVDVRLTLKAALMPVFSVNGFGVPVTGGNPVKVPAPTTTEIPETRP